ncbi:MAG: amino acid--tRNA ligase-related protein, partial [Candidatus Nanoarchaeia archaeon]
MRMMGKASFATIQDQTGKIQFYIREDEVGKEQYELFQKTADIGDIVGVEGNIFRTKMGEITINTKKFTILAKSLRPLPEKYHGLKDEEEKLRKRYLDLLLNSEVKDLFLKKEKFWNVVRDFMKKRGFIEVETPILEVTAGGADARPFITHHNDFNIDVYLRISVGELWQKRLMAAGFEKTFEIGKVFRN